MEIELRGRTAIITGAGSGIGRGCSVAMAAAGASVVLNDINADGLAVTALEVAAVGGTSIQVVADVSDSDDVTRMVAQAVDAFGGVDILDANAGVERYGVLETMSDADMDRILAVDLRGALLCARAVTPLMRARGGGSIIFTSSVQATHSLPGSVVYAAAKAGLVAAARTLSLEVGADGIRVNCVSPGTIETPMLTAALDGMDLAGSQDFLRKVAQANSLKRIGRIDEVAAAVVFLASAPASYITGTNLVVDGGFTAVKQF